MREREKNLKYLLLGYLRQSWKKFYMKAIPRQMKNDEKLPSGNIKLTYHQSRASNQHSNHSNIQKWYCQLEFDYVGQQT